MMRHALALARLSVADAPMTATTVFDPSATAPGRP